MPSASGKKSVSNTTVVSALLRVFLLIMWLMWWAAALTAGPSPTPRRISRLRKVRLRALGYTKTALRFSMVRDWTPWWASSVEAARPTAPAPTIRTG
jgi:hypothetical protein